MVTESIEICPININTLITNPFRLQSGDIITLCGNSAKDNKSNDGLGYILGYYNCNDGPNPNNGRFITTALFSGSSAYTTAAYECNGVTSQYQCFSDSITLSSAFNACEIQFFVGFNIQNTNQNSLANVSWTLNVERPG
jgi:hypothetical protein